MTNNDLAIALKGKKLILASGSPRRKEFFEKLGVPFSVRVADADESYPSGLSECGIAEHISRIKAHAAGTSDRDEIIVAADTIVWEHGHVLGKPSGKKQAEEMLARLSGKTHSVVTGVTIRSADKEETFSAVTRVTFSPLSENDIKYYVDNFSPMDKAGAYAIQEWIGETHITSIEGSYHNVVGLPTAELYSRLKKFVE